LPHVEAIVDALFAEFNDQLTVTCTPDPYIHRASCSDDLVPVDDWSYKALQVLQRHGLLGDSHLAHVDPSQPLSRSTLADMLFIALANVREPVDPEISDLLDRLYFEFDDCLRLCAVALAERPEAAPLPGLLPQLLSDNSALPLSLSAPLPGPSLLPGSILQPGSDRLPPVGIPPFRAYDDVPRAHWAYAALGYLSRTGTLEGYPAGFFDTPDKDLAPGHPTLTCYELGGAACRVQDYAYYYKQIPPFCQAMANDLVAEFYGGLEMNCEPPFNMTPPATGPRSLLKADDWAFSAYAALQARGVLPGFKLGNYTCPSHFSRYDFADMIMAATSRAFKLQDPEVDAIIDQLYFEFRDCLRLCAVAPAQR